MKEQECGEEKEKGKRGDQMSNIVLHVLKRNETGKGYCKGLRRQGKIPGILYGAEETPVPFEVDLKTIETAIRTGGRNAIISLIIGGEQDNKIETLLRDYQVDPIHRDFIHVDFQHISLTQTLRVEVPITIKGVAQGVKNEGGILEHILYTIEMECLPTEIPEHIEVDVSSLGIGDSVKVEQLLGTYPGIISDPNDMVLTIVPPTVPVEVAIPSEEEVAQPEVIEKERKGKEEEE